MVPTERVPRVTDAGGVPRPGRGNSGFVFTCICIVIQYNMLIGWYLIMCRNRVKLTLPALLEVVDIIKYGRGQFQFFFTFKWMVSSVCWLIIWFSWLDIDLMIAKQIESINGLVPISITCLPYNSYPLLWFCPWPCLSMFNYKPSYLTLQY